MSNSYLVSVYSRDEANVIGVFDKRFKREPRRDRGCCTLTVIAESIEDALEKAKLVVKGEE